MQLLVRLLNYHVFFSCDPRVNQDKAMLRILAESLLAGDWETDDGIGEPFLGFDGRPNR